METARSLGARIGAIRRRRGLTQEQLAARIDRSVNTVGSFERGQSLPSVETLWRLAPALGVPVGAFFVPDGGAVESPRQAALLSDMLDGARRLTSRDLQFTARIVRLIVEHHGRRGVVDGRV